MTIILALLVYVPAILIGFLLLHLVWREDDLLSLFMKFCLGIGAGLGISSILYFLILLIWPEKIPFIEIQLIFLAIILALNILDKRFSMIDFRFSITRPFLFLLSAFLLITLASFINYSIRRDQGAFDAWMIYNRAARFIYRDTANWQATLSPDLYWGSHADYPLLLALNVASSWETLRDENMRVPSIQSGLFLFATIGLLLAALARSNTATFASIAAMVLMSTPGFVRSGSGQTADVPFAFFMLAGIVLIYLSDIHPEKKLSNLLIILSGFAAGLAGWTKNEGLLFISVVVAVLLAISWRERSINPFAHFFLGLAVPGITIVVFKALAPSSDLLSGASARTLVQIIDPSRYVIILKSLLHEMLTFGEWPLPVLLLLIVIACVLGFNRQIPYALCAMLALQLLGYLFVYIITPHDLDWQIGTAFDRNMLQIFPSFLFVLFISMENYHASSD